jgi:hypothetical protein
MDHPLLLPVILFAPEVVMQNRFYRIDRRKKGLLVEALLQNGFYVFVGTGVQGECTSASGFETFI